MTREARATCTDGSPTRPSPLPPLLSPDAKAVVFPANDGEQETGGGDTNKEEEGEAGGRQEGEGEEEEADKSMAAA